MGSEKNYRIKTSSKQLNLSLNKNFKFSTLNSNSKLNPRFVTGLIDGEGSFYVSIYKHNDYKLGWCVLARFAIGLHKRDLPLLLSLQKYFGGIGSFSHNKSTNVVTYLVSGVKDLTNIIIPHFEKI